MAEGEGAFYAPKIDVHIKDALNRRWQLSTLQVDFQFPNLFDLEFVGEDGARHRPFMIHRALFGSIERFFAILLEHYAGAFPTWLAPVQVVGIPISDGRMCHIWRSCRRAAEGSPYSRRGRRVGRSDAEEDSQRATPESAVHAARG